MKNIHNTPPKLSCTSLALGLLVVILSVVFLLVGNANAFTDNRFVVNEVVSGLCIDSFPEKMNNIPKQNYPHLLICFTRTNGTWDKRNIISGAQNCSNEKVNSAEPKIVALMKTLDKIIPNDEGIIAFSYILCYHDAVIYFERDYSYDKMCLIATQLNIEGRNN